MSFVVVWFCSVSQCTNARRASDCSYPLTTHFFLPSGLTLFKEQQCKAVYLPQNGPHTSGFCYSKGQYSARLTQATVNHCHHTSEVMVENTISDFKKGVWMHLKKFKVDKYFHPINNLIQAVFLLEEVPMNIFLDQVPLKIHLNQVSFKIL